MYSHHTNTPCMLAITLPGTSNQERAYSQMVQQLFEKKIISGFFNTAAQSTSLSFEDICKASDIIISSSTQEGFGFTYIGAASWKTPLLARNIPVKKDNLQVLKGWPMHWYENIYIPLSLFEKQMVYTIKQSYKEKINAQSHLLSSQIIHHLLNSVDTLFNGDAIDFSFLSINMQIMIIEMCKHSPTTHANSDALSRITHANKNLMNKIDILLHHPDTPTTIQDIHNNVETYHSEKSFIQYFKKALNRLYKNNIPLSKPIAKKCANYAIARFAQLPYLRLLYDPYIDVGPKNN